jgi:exopolyphosphatase/guanosine-5'-triphosphate,3'-diphosphate pyrophosphatase
MDEVDRVLGIPEVAARAHRIIGVAGTFTSLAAIQRRLDRYDPDLVHGTVMSRADIEAMVGRLAALDIAATAAIPSLEPGRAPVILAGAVVAERVMSVVGADEVVVSESDLLDAVADELLAG